MASFAGTQSSVVQVSNPKMSNEQSAASTVYPGLPTTGTRVISGVEVGLPKITNFNFFTPALHVSCCVYLICLRVHARRARIAIASGPAPATSLGSFMLLLLAAAFCEVCSPSSRLALCSVGSAETRFFKQRRRMDMRRSSAPFNWQEAGHSKKRARDIRPRAIVVMQLSFSSLSVRSVGSFDG